MDRAIADDCKDAGDRAAQGTVAERVGRGVSKTRKVT
jgi:hypothetical protein